MADPLDDSGPGESEPGLLPEGEFASHFFEEVAHSDHAAQSNPESAEALLPTRSPSSLSELPPPQPDAPVGHPVSPCPHGTGLPRLDGGRRDRRPAPGAECLASGAEARPTPAPAADAPAKDSAVNALAESLKTEVGGLSKQVKELEERLAALKPTPAPDLEALNTKVAELSKSAESVAALPKKVDALDERVGGLDTSLKSLQQGMTPLKDEIAALRGDLKKAPAAWRQAPRLP